MTDTNLAQAVEAANEASSYDTNIKFLLADKQILARIFKHVTCKRIQYRRQCTRRGKNFLWYPFYGIS